MSRQYAEQHSLVRELAETKHAQQVADHLRTRELQELEHDKNLRMLHERANAEIQLCSNKQAATELQMRHLQEELREAQAANAKNVAVG